MEAKRILTLTDDEHGKQYNVVQVGPEHFELCQHGHTTDTRRDGFLGKFESKAESLQY
jgi:hypothetical protein